MTDIADVRELLLAGKVLRVGNSILRFNLDDMRMEYKGLTGKWNPDREPLPDVVNHWSCKQFGYEVLEEKADD